MTNKEKILEAQRLINEVLESESEAGGFPAEFDFFTENKIGQLHHSVEIMIKAPERNLI